MEHITIGETRSTVEADVDLFLQDDRKIGLRKFAHPCLKMNISEAAKDIAKVTIKYEVA